MNTYRSLDIVGEHYYGEGEFEHEFSPDDEADVLGAGHVELVPRLYRQLSNNYSATEQGETFEAAFLVEHEAALIQGGHIERVDKPDKSRDNDKPAKPPARRRTTTKGKG